MQDPDIINTRAYLTIMKRNQRKKVSNVLNSNQNIKYSNGYFIIRSEKFINQYYKVFPHIDQNWGCTCQAFYKWGSKSCKHITAAKAYILLHPNYRI